MRSDVMSMNPAAPRAYMQSIYEENGRWRWQIIVNDHDHSVVVARSVPTYPMERDANAAARDVLRQLIRGVSR